MKWYQIGFKCVAFVFHELWYVLLQSMHASVYGMDVGKCIPCILYTILMVFKLIGILICCRESTNVNKRDTVLHTNENQTHTHNWAIDCRQPSQRLKSITRRQFQIMFVTLILTLSQHIRSPKKEVWWNTKMLNWHKDQMKCDYKPPRNGLCGWMLWES